MTIEAKGIWVEFVERNRTVVRKTAKSAATRRQWGTILDTACVGDEVVIERYNKPVALLLNYHEYEKTMQVITLMISVTEGEGDVVELNDLLGQIVARRHLQQYLADPSIGVPYEEVRCRMVSKGYLDE